MCPDLGYGKTNNIIISAIGIDWVNMLIFNLEALQ